jgi:hypothetical protein
MFMIFILFDIIVKPLENAVSENHALPSEKRPNKNG